MIRKADFNLQFDLRISSVLLRFSKMQADFQTLLNEESCRLCWPDNPMCISRRENRETGTVNIPTTCLPADVAMIDFPSDKMWRANAYALLGASVWTPECMRARRVRFAAEDAVPRLDLYERGSTERC
jgi:hypothetical protein